MSRWIDQNELEMVALGEIDQAPQRIGGDLRRQHRVGVVFALRCPGMRPAAVRSCFALAIGRLIR